MGIGALQSFPSLWLPTGLQIPGVTSDPPIAIGESGKQYLTANT